MATKKKAAPPQAVGQPEAAPAKADRPYLGAADVATGPKPGTIRFQDYLRFLFQMKSLGIYANRPARGSNQPSVHRTGRAADIGGGPNQLTACLRFLDQHCRLALQEIHDYLNLYQPGKHGAGWRCDRDAWRSYDKPTLGPGGQWIHYELEPDYANNPQLVDALFQRIFADVNY